MRLRLVLTVVVPRILVSGWKITIAKSPRLFEVGISLDSNRLPLRSAPSDQTDAGVNIFGIILQGPCCAGAGS